MQCLNCNGEVTLNYCPQCGQKATIGPISLTGLVRELPHAIFHIDKGFLYNVIQLFSRPGQAITDYLKGKRQPFFHPVSYLVIALVLNYLVVKVTDLHFYDEGELSTMEPIAAQALRDYDGMQWWFLEHTYIYILIAIPSSTVFLYVLFRILKQTFNVAESAVIVLFTIAQGVLIQTILYSCFGWIDSGPFRRTLETINMTILILYASHVIYQLISKERKTIFRIVGAGAGGFGLAAVWIASAYILYLMLT